MSAKVEIIEDDVERVKPNFKDIFNIKSDDDMFVQSSKQTTNSKQQSQTKEDKQSDRQTNKQDSKQQSQQNEKPKRKPFLGGGTNKTQQIIIFILCGVVIAACIVLFVYYFVAMRRNKVEILRLMSDCENYKKIADDLTGREGHLVNMYETEKSDLQQHITHLEDEVRRLTEERDKRLRKEMFERNKQQKQSIKSGSIMHKQTSKHSKRSSIPSTQPNKPKVEIVEEHRMDEIEQDNQTQSSDDEQIVSEQQTNTQDEGFQEDNNEFNITVPKYEEAPTCEKTTSTISPTQQVKNLINNKANKNFKNKMTAIQQSNEVNDTYEQDQIEYSTQLGLNKSRQINTDKLNNVVSRMEQAVDEQQKETEETNQRAIDEDEDEQLAQLIVN